MMYATVEIRPDAFEPKWCVSFQDIPHNREGGEGSLSALGFFHYPRQLGKKAAFEKLKARMIEEHQKQIKSLTESVAKLRELEMPKA